MKEELFEFGTIGIDSSKPSYIISVKVDSHPAYPHRTEEREGWVATPFGYVVVHSGKMAGVDTVYITMIKDGRTYYAHAKDHQLNPEELSSAAHHFSKEVYSNPDRQWLAYK